VGAGLAITPEWPPRIEYLYVIFGSASGAVYRLSARAPIV
jgi:hypothetical protein